MNADRHRRLKTLVFGSLSTALGAATAVGAVIVATALSVLLVGDTFRAFIHLGLGGVVVWQLRGFLPRRE